MSSMVRRLDRVADQLERANAGNHGGPIVRMTDEDRRRAIVAMYARCGVPLRAGLENYIHTDNATTTEAERRQQVVELWGPLDAIEETPAEDAWDDDLVAAATQPLPAEDVNGIQSADDVIQSADVEPINF